MALPRGTRKEPRSGRTPPDPAPMRLPIQDARARGADWMHRLLDTAAAQTAERQWLPRVGFLSSLRSVAGDPMRLRTASAEGGRSRAGLSILREDGQRRMMRVRGRSVVSSGNARTASALTR